MNCRLMLLLNLLFQLGELCRSLILLSRYKPSSFPEKAVHLFKRDPLGLRQKCPEKYGVCNIADDEEEKVSPALCLDRYRMLVEKVQTLRSTYLDL